MNKTTKTLLSAVLFATLAAPGITPKAHAGWGDIFDRAADRQKDKAKRETEKEVNETIDETVDGTINAAKGNKGDASDSEQGLAIKTRRETVHFPQGEISFADQVVDYQDAEYISRKYADPQAALGLPDGKQYVTLGGQHSLTLEFTDNYLVDVDGVDLWIFEAGSKNEPVHVAISKDGTNWIHVGTVEGGTSGLDISKKVQPGDRFSYVKLIDGHTDSNRSGAGIDAVGAIGSIARTSEPSHAENAPTAAADSYKLRIEMNNGTVYLVGLDEVKVINTQPAGNGDKCFNLRIELKSGGVYLIELSKVTQMTPVLAG